MDQKKKERFVFWDFCFYCSWARGFWGWGGWGCGLGLWVLGKGRRGDGDGEGDGKGKERRWGREGKGWEGKGEGGRGCIRSGGWDEISWAMILASEFGCMRDTHISDVRLGVD